MDITIDFATIKSAVRQQLSVIGKHHASQQGGSLFSTTALTDIETNVMPTFIVASAQLVVAELSPVVRSYKATDDSISLEVSQSRWANALQQAFPDSVRSFIIADVLQAVLSMIVPDVATKYADDAKSLLAALVGITFSKVTPAQSDEEFSSVSGKMCNDDGSEFTGS